MIHIGTHPIGKGYPCFIIAEISCNHNGSLDLAKKLVEAAAWTGADAVKFQTYRPSCLAVESDHKAHRLTKGPWAGKRLWDLYEEAQTPWQWMPELFALAKELGLVPLTSVSSFEGLGYVETTLDPVAYKIPSAEVTDLELVKAIALTGKPVIVSDGMATPLQLAAALEVLGTQAILLRCVSQYPAAPESYRLSAIRHLAGRDTPIGISDHTRGHHIAVAAVALGARVIEKHIMLQPEDYETEPLDVGHSMEPRDFWRMVQAVRAVERSLAAAPMLGVEEGVGTGFRRRLVFIADLSKGTKIRAEHTRTARTGEGLEPEADVIGRVVRGDVSYGDPVTEDILK